MLMLVHLCCLYFCILDYYNILYIAFLAAIATLQVTMSVCNELYSSCNIVVTVLYVVIINVTNDLDAIFAT